MGVWGNGQLGLGDNDNRNVPTVVRGLGGVVAVEAGHAHSLALARDGTLRSWGSSYHGQLGLGGWDNRFSPTMVVGLRHVVDMAGGSMHTIAATLEGHVYTWGDGTPASHAELCLLPTRVTAGLEGLVVLLVNAGDEYSMAVTQSGQLLTWGNGYFGQLGHDPEEYEKVPRVVEGAGVVVGVAGGEVHSMAVRESGEVVVFGNGGDLEEQDEEGNELDEPVFVAEGCLGLGAELGELLRPTVVPGIRAAVTNGDERRVTK